MSSSLENTNNDRIVAIGNPERQVCKPLQCGSKQQWTSHAIITFYCLTAPHVAVLLFAHLPFVVNCASKTRRPRGCNNMF